MTKQTRRVFLQQAAGAAAACSVLPRFARADVNSQIRVAVVGFNGRGKNHIDGFKDQFVALCDCDSRVLARGAEEFEKSHGRKLDQVTDFRRLLDRNDIDAISIATPNHTHSLIAISGRAGGQGRLCREAGQPMRMGRPAAGERRRSDTKRIVQCGTQARSHKAIQEAVEYRPQRQAWEDSVRHRHVLQTAARHRQARSAARDSERDRLRLVVRAGGEGRSLSAAGFRTTTGIGTTTPATATWATRASTRWISPAGSWA